MRPRAIGIVLLALSLLAACQGGNAGSTGGYVSSDGSVTTVDAADRDPAPTLSGPDLDGNDLSTDDYAGKILVINVWGSWCAPCRAEAPILKELSESYSTDEVQFLGIVARSSDSASKAFNSTYEISYPSFSDDGGSLELEFIDTLPTQAIPTTWVIDADNRVAARISDEVDPSILGGIIDDLIAEKNPA